MEKLKFIETNNLEKLGEYFFLKGVRFGLNREFGKAYEFFKESLDCITCDCCFIDWNIKNANVDPNIFNDLENYNSNHSEYFFVKAFMLTYAKELKNPHIALDAIDAYLTKVQDEYGYYIKGKILQKLDLNVEALECYLKSQTISNNSRINYRIGRLKEQYLNEYGLDDLFISLIQNNSSSCCAKELKLYYNKSDLELIENNENFELWNLFTDKQTHFITFWTSYFRITNKQISEERIVDVSNMNLIKRFIEILKSNYDIFIMKSESEQNERDYDDDEYESNYDDYNWNNEYYNDGLDMDQQSKEYWENLGLY